MLKAMFNIEIVISQLVQACLLRRLDKNILNFCLSVYYNQVY